MCKSHFCASKGASRNERERVWLFSVERTNWANCLATIEFIVFLLDANIFYFRTITWAWSIFGPFGLKISKMEKKIKDSCIYVAYCVLNRFFGYVQKFIHFLCAKLSWWAKTPCFVCILLIAVHSSSNSEFWINEKLD